MKLFRITLIAAMVLASGCAIFDNRPPEQVVADRAQERVNLLMRGDFEKAYRYATPGYRATNTVDQYAADFGGVSMWLEAEVGEVNCPLLEEVLVCDVVTLISYNPPRMGYVQTTQVPERWIKVENGWYLVVK